MRRRIRTPIILQLEAAECGAAALASVLAYHGRWVPLEELRLACGVSRDGSKASNIIRAARHYGLIARAFRKEPAGLPDLPLPAIIFWNFNHFVVLEDINEKGARINDPAFGRRLAAPDEFDESFTGVVLTFMPGEMFKSGGRRRNQVQGLAERLDGTSGALLFAILASFGLVVTGLSVPAFTRIFIDEVLIQKLDDWLLPLAAAVLVSGGLTGCLLWLQQHKLARFRNYVALRESLRFVWHVLRLPVAYFSQRYAIEIARRTALNDRIATLISSDLATSALNSLMIMIYAAVMAQYDLVLTAVGIGFSLANLFALWLIGRRSADIGRRLQMDVGLLNTATVRGFAMIDTMKATGTESLFLARWSGYHAKVLNAEQELGRMNALLGAVPFGLSTVGTVVVVVLGGLRVMEGTISLGMLLGFQTLLALFLQPVYQLVSFGNQLQEVRSSLERLDDVLRQDFDPSFPSMADAPEELPGRLVGALTVDAISYGFSTLDPPLIDGFTLEVPPGGRVALVGPSGSGKSTLGRLIAAVYQPWRGAIRLADHSYEHIPRSTLRCSIAYVDQNSVLFPGTIRDNVGLWDPTLPNERLVQAAQDALILSEITARPLGFEYVVQEGGRDFSGGQRQRIVLARALALNPSLIVLDEATNELDTATEFQIMENIRRRGCSCVVIAHRLSTIRTCDEILVLDQGKVLERGTHNALIAGNGLYRSLVAN